MLQTKYTFFAKSQTQYLFSASHSQGYYDCNAVKNLKYITSLKKIFIWKKKNFIIMKKFQMKKTRFSLNVALTACHKLKIILKIFGLKHPKHTPAPNYYR
jgi:hypothetical protein